MMYALVVGFLAVAMALIIPPLANEIQGFTRSFDFIPLQEELKHFRFSLTEASQLLNSIGGSVTTLMNVITSTFSGIFTVFSILVMSFYLISDRENLYKKISWISKDDRHLNLSKELIDSIELQLGGWIRGQFILMTLIGVVDFIGLSLLNVPFALPLALLAGGLEILPNLGPTIAAVPGIVLAYSSGGWVMAAVVTLFYLVVQQLENNLIVPKIMKANVDVNPLATILTMLIGVKIAGVVGALLAVPCYIILRSLYSLARREKWEW